MVVSVRFCEMIGIIVLFSRALFLKCDLYAIQCLAPNALSSQSPTVKSYLLGDCICIINAEGRQAESLSDTGTAATQADKCIQMSWKFWCFLNLVMATQRKLKLKNSFPPLSWLTFLPPYSSISLCQDDAGFRLLWPEFHTTLTKQISNH